MGLKRRIVWSVYVIHYAANDCGRFGGMVSMKWRIDDRRQYFKPPRVLAGGTKLARS